MIQVCSSTALGPSFHTVPRSKARKLQPNLNHKLSCLSTTRPYYPAEKARLQPHHITPIINDGRQWANKHRNTSRLKEVEVSLVSFHLPQSVTSLYCPRTFPHKRTSKTLHAPHAPHLSWFMSESCCGCEPRGATIRMMPPLRVQILHFPSLLAPPLWSL